MLCIGRVCHAKSSVSSSDRLSVTSESKFVMKSVTAETRGHGEHGIAPALRESRGGAPSRVKGAGTAPDQGVSGVSKNPERVVVNVERCRPYCRQL